MATVQNPLSTGDEDRLHLANMSDPQFATRQFSFNRSNVFAPDGQIVFPDLYAEAEKSSSSPMSFVTRDRFTEAQATAARPVDQAEQLAHAEASLKAEAAAKTEPAVRTEGVLNSESASLSAQEMQKRMAEPIIPSMEKATPSGFAGGVERGGNYTIAGGF